MDLADRDKCFCCGACISICPRKAITSKYEDGFFYPQIDKERCIDCGLCKMACPAVRKARGTVAPGLYAFQHSDPELVAASSSGAAFTAVSNIVLAHSGLIVGAVMDRSLTVRHTISENEAGRNAMRGAKYVQSDMTGLFKELETPLSEQRLILFTGTPCQTDAFRSYCMAAGLNMDKVILCALVCHGASSPVVWKRYTEEYLRETEKADDIRINFRCKDRGWRNNRITASIDGKEIDLSTYSSLYFSNLCSRRSCFSCPYTTPFRNCDITIGDFWTISQFDPDFVEGYGVSMILTHSEKGDLLVRSCEKYGLLKSLMFDAQRDTLQPAMIRPYSKPIEYERFWRDFERLAFPAIIRKYVGNSIYDRARRKIRKTLMKE